MKIYIKSAKAEQADPKAAAQTVNRMGKYLSKHLDGVYKTHKSANAYDIYVNFVYQSFPEYTESPPVQELNILIMITTYNKKIRIDTIELTPLERTLGFDLFPLELLTNTEQGMYLILKSVKENLKKAYPEMIGYGF